jgi:hypothetical protein
MTQDEIEQAVFMLLRYNRAASPELEEIYRYWVSKIPAPTCKTAPYVDGTGTVGMVLTCTMGTWTGEPTSYAYKWLRDNTPVISIDSKYTIVAADSGHGITCVVTATNIGGSTDSPPSNKVDVS